MPLDPRSRQQAHFPNPGHMTHPRESEGKNNHRLASRGILSPAADDAAGKTIVSTGGARRTVHR